MEFSNEIINLTKEAEKALEEQFKKIDEIAFINTSKVMDAFRENRVSDSIFAGSTGYGYDDKGRDTLDKVFAYMFDAPAALVRHTIANGTAAISAGLYALLRPGDVMLSVTGKPYDTLLEAIGILGEEGNGSLKDFGVIYDEIELDGGKINLSELEKKLSDKVKVVYIQRSKGYSTRPTLSSEEIGEVVSFVKKRSNAFVVVDNCYGEFCETKEPTAYGADLAIGSLIKNPGGGMALSGGYFAGSERAIELVSYRLTSVGVGGEVGATLGQSRDLFKGIFYAPHTVAQALKTAHLAAYIFEKLGYEVSPKYNEARHDIIQTVQCGSGESLCAFCRGIQKGSPIDSFVTPEPWDMPGYADQVIMAAGAFVQGASIELSADGPMREPYTVFFQGGLTYESGKYGIMCAASEVGRKV
jgi:cystathionine beta-lyase family protein involved in aluminum resistance